MSFFLGSWEMNRSAEQTNRTRIGSWEMNRSAEQTNRTRTASRFTRFVCSALQFISHEPRKKDTHSLNIVNSMPGKVL